MRTTFIFIKRTKPLVAAAATTEKFLGCAYDLSYANTPTPKELVAKRRLHNLQHLDVAVW